MAFVNFARVDNMRVIASLAILAGNAHWGRAVDGGWSCGNKAVVHPRGELFEVYTIQT
jgi:hypothetical protein